MFPLSHTINVCLLLSNKPDYGCVVILPCTSLITSDYGHFFRHLFDCSQKCLIEQVFFTHSPDESTRHPALKNLFSRKSSELKFKTLKPRTGEMVWWFKMLVHNHQNLSSNPQHSPKSQMWRRALQSQHSYRWWEVGSEKSQMLEGQWVCCRWWKSNKETLSQSNPRLSSDLHMHTMAHV